MEKRVLVLTDYVGFGDVAMSPIRSILIKKGFNVFCLPTAILSNTWNNGNCSALDTTVFLQQSLATWERMGIRFDAVLIGYLCDAVQASWVAQCCEKWKQNGSIIVLDPLFADNGKLYRGITSNQIHILQNIMEKADIVLPNSTEAQFLAGIGEPKSVLSLCELQEILKAFHEWKASKVLITGACVEGEMSVISWDGNGLTQLPYETIEGKFSGAGDAFSAFFLAEYLKSGNILKSTQTAISDTREILLKSLNDQRDVTGIPVERYL